MKYVSIRGRAYPVPSPLDFRIMEALEPGEQFGLSLVDSGVCPRGSIYVTMQRLEDAGVLTTREEPRTKSEGGLPRRFYKLTPMGLQVLIAWRAFCKAWDEHEQLASVPSHP